MLTVKRTAYAVLALTLLTLVLYPAGDRSPGSVAPTAVVATTEPTEDSPGRDCHTHGNGRCGNRHVTGGWVLQSHRATAYSATRYADCGDGMPPCVTWDENRWYFVGSYTPFRRTALHKCSSGRTPCLVRLPAAKYLVIRAER